METECLLLGSEPTTLAVKVGFLHLLWREVGELQTNDIDDPVPDEPKFCPVEVLKVGENVFHTWQEGVEREVNLPHLVLNDLAAQPHRLDFGFRASRTSSLLRQPNGQMVGRLVRQQQAVTGTVEVSAEQVSAECFKIRVRIENLTPFQGQQSNARDEALMCSFISTHTILSVQEGEFLSLLDPPEEYREIAAGCHNRGTYPVLVGETSERDMLLSSPIILYDYPQIAPESAGDLFDSTEIDEILTLRILTLTDEEKREARQADERVRALLERTEALSPELLMKLHGTVRSLRPL
jgi:hydrogenase maturation protease